MRLIFFLFIICMQLPGMSQTTKDSIAVIKLLKNDYTTMQTIDFEKHKSNCTSNYLLIENGEVLTLEGEKVYRTDDFDFRYVKIDGNTAYTVYNLKSIITEDGQTKNKNWNETVVFKKINGQWKIELIHSTPVPQ